MNYRILVGLPLGCPKEFNQRFEHCLEDALRSVECVDFVADMQALFYKLFEGANKYNLLVVMDQLGLEAEYVPFLNGIRHRLAELKMLVIIPDGRKGSSYLSEMYHMGLYHGLFQRDINPANIRELIQVGRTKEDACAYYQIPEDQNATENALMRYGTVVEEESRDSAIKIRRLKGGIVIRRMCSQDVKRTIIGSQGDEENFAFLDKEKFGMDRIGKEEMKEYAFALDEAWMEQYLLKLNMHYTKEGLMDYQSYEMGKTTEEEFLKNALVVMEKFPLSKEQKMKLFETFLRDTKSYGKLDVALNNMDVSDIRLIDEETVNVQLHGVWYRSNIKFRSKEEYCYFINRLCTKNRVAVNQVQAQVIFSDIDTNSHARLRFAVTAALLNSNRLPSAHIRKINKQKKLADELIAEEMLTKRQAGFLISAIRNGKSIIFCGGSGSGKTILLNCLLEYASDNICGACVQEAEELFSDTKKNLEFTHSINNKGEGKVQHTLHEIATAALLKNAKLFIIGEIKGNEARDFFSAAITGAQCLCTTHAISVFEALTRIADLAKYAGDFTQEDLLKMLTRGIDFVVHMDGYKVTDIAGVVGYDEVRKDVIYDLYEIA